MDGSRRGAGLLAAGFALGLLLPRLVALRSTSSSENSTDAPSPSSQKDSDKSKDSNKPADKSTHAVRAASSSSVRIPASDLSSLLGRIFESAGCPPSSASLVASVLCYADKRGIPSHGCNRADSEYPRLCVPLLHTDLSPLLH